MSSNAQSPTRTTFADGLVGRSNAFGLARLVLALLVIVGHAFPVGGWGADPTGPLTRGQAELGDIAVVGFFAVSGYLIAISAMRTPLLGYLWRRFLRIMPGFWVCLLVTALLLGPIDYYRSHGSFDGYFNEPGGPATFVGMNALLLMRQFTINGVFEGAPLGAGVLNGSLWTLFFEVLCYLILAGLAALGLLKQKWRWCVPALAVVFYAITVLAPIVGWHSFTLTALARLGSAFLTGATVAVYRDQLPFNGWLAALSGVLVVGTALLGGFLTVGYVALTYLILWAAGRAPRALHRIGSVNDVSYGVYIYAWPVQMMLAIAGAPALGFGWYVVLCVAAVLPLAAASWWLIEKPAIALKGRLPDRLLVVRGAAEAPVGGQENPCSVE